jgi:hypothetical protein
MEKRPEEEKEHKPRTDLPPEREPYYEGYFGTEEEEGVAGEEEAPEERRPRRGRPEDNAGGDREIG